MEGIKKLFVSVPMRGRNDKDIDASIDKMWDIAEAVTGEKLQLIDSMIDGMAPFDNRMAAVFYLGEAIKKMAEADYIITVKDAWEYAGCMIEQDVAHKYGIPVIYIDMAYVCPDVIEMDRKRRAEAVPVCECGEVGFR